MSAEFYISFADPSWYTRNLHRLEAALQELGTFTEKRGVEFRLCGEEDRNAPGRWSYDVRLIPLDPSRILMEVSAHPRSIESDLSMFLEWLRSETKISVLDEDGEPAGW